MFIFGQKSVQFMQPLIILCKLGSNFHTKFWWGKCKQKLCCMSYVLGKWHFLSSAINLYLYKGVPTQMGRLKMSLPCFRPLPTENYIMGTQNKDAVLTKRKNLHWLMCHWWSRFCQSIKVNSYLKKPFCFLNLNAIWILVASSHKGNAYVLMIVERVLSLFSF